jgi:cell fate regulator YaaT (PSP1 superfamily)
MVEARINLEELFAKPPEPPLHGGCAGCGTGKLLGETTQCGNGLEKIYPTTAVRFGYMRYIGEFSHPADMRFTCGAKVVIQTKRGIEMGEQVSLTCTGCSKSVTRDQMRAWVENCGQDSYIFEAGRILREATGADLAEYAHIQASNRERRKLCQDMSRQQNLPIRVIECESPFGGERIIFYFTAETRVDFRNLVKDLTREYRTRIEMRQVGARDEARLLADYETCGREVCCKVFLKTLRPITMRMAKLQKATLDPTQVSGRCGRLKCCLRYEHVGYEELDKRLPRMGEQIRTNHGDGVVVNRQVLTQLVQIRKVDETLVTVVAEDIEGIGYLPGEAPRRVEPAGETEPAEEHERERQPKESGNRERSRGRRRPRQPDGQQPPRAEASAGSAPAGDDDDNRGNRAEDAGPQGGRPPRGRRRGGRRRGRGRPGPGGPLEPGAPPPPDGGGD